MTGGAGAVTRTFTRDSSSGDYVASGNVRFRYASTGDLIVGGHNFSGGVLPYVAARGFVASVAQIAGSYDLATRNVPTAGAPSTHAGTALINGNTLSVCQSDVAQVTTVAACDAAALKSYSLSLNGSVFTGISSGGESYSFVVASSGAAKFLLSAGLAPDNSQQLRVGLVDSSGGLTYGAVRGPSTGADWLAITLAGGTPPTYAAASAIGSGSSDAANLARPNPSAGPFSMLTGTSTTYNAPIYVMQASPLVIVIGSGGFGGAAANGLFEIAVP